VPRDAIIRKANQIAANFAFRGEEQGARDAAAHIRLYWPPALRDELVALAESGSEELSPLARATAKVLAQR